MVDMHRPKLNVGFPIAPKLQAMEENRRIQATAEPHQQLAVR